MKFKHKFKAKPVYEDGHYSGSTLEWKYLKQLQLMQKSGEVLMFVEQAKFRLPGGVKYVVDYVVFYADGSVSFVDVKGVETETFKIKRKIVQDLYPVEITIVKKGDF